MKAEYAMTLESLAALVKSGEFDHATYRNQGTLWEGLHIYCKKEGGFRGYGHAGVFPKDDPDLDAAFDMLHGTGISLGAYGRG